jgi:hypothetical protein
MILKRVVKSVAAFAMIARRSTYGYTLCFIDTFTMKQGARIRKSGIKTNKTNKVVSQSPPLFCRPMLFLRVLLTVLLRSYRQCLCHHEMSFVFFSTFQFTSHIFYIFQFCYYISLFPANFLTLFFYSLFKRFELPMTKVTGFLITFRECLSPRRPPWFPRLVASDSLVWLSGFLYPHGAGFVRR